MMSTKAEKWKTLMPESIPFHNIVTRNDVEQWFKDALVSKEHCLKQDQYEQLARDVDSLSRQYFSFDIRAQLLEMVGDAAIELERAIDDFEQYEAGGNWADTFAETRYHLLKMTYLGKRTIKTGRKRAPWHRFAQSMASLFIAALRQTGYSGSLEPRNSESTVAVLSASACARAFHLPALDPAGFSQALKARDRRGLSDRKIKSETARTSR